ncbi:sigma-54 dependent transcriptional regulator [bacterium]|nr:sigma-54 dependent transcriptional regulator [bacterium]MBU1919452.1 sigma-54 dependent transcriptional regulator [bacterium]
MPQGRILIIDDEPDILDNCRVILQRASFETHTLQDSTKTADTVEEFDPDIVLTDLMLPGLDGMGVLQIMKERFTDVPVVMMTAYATVETAVEAMKAGAEDYIVKPFTKEQLVLLITRVMKSRSLLVENKRLRHELDLQQLRTSLIAHSNSMKEVLSIVSRVSDSKASVFILGESGTGKEVVARAIHNGSAGAGAPFIAINCSALPPQLIESELFGYEKGAFTGANTSKKGLLEEANSGTLFLDEITEMDTGMQAKLLRVVQERKLRRLGGNREIDLNLRIVSASNRDIEEAIKDNKLREDLYFRLAVVTLKLPPLRERRDDIRPLAESFLKEFTETSNKTVTGFTPRVLDLLTNYAWPGNVRELRNVVERAASLTTHGAIREEDLPEEITRANPRQIRIDLTEPYSEAKARAMDSFQREYFMALLEEEKFNISRVAERARVDRKTIYRIMKSYGLDRDDNSDS